MMSPLATSATCAQEKEEKEEESASSSSSSSCFRQQQQPQRAAAGAGAPAPVAGDYEVAHVIGEGSFGCVWYGRHKATQQPVAMKVVDKWSCRKHPELISSITTEQAILKSLSVSNNNNDKDNDNSDKDNNNKVSPILLASFHDDECVYLVLDCCLGGSLHEWIEHVHNVNNNNNDNSRVLPRSIPEYTRQLLHAVCHLHSRGIVHGDLKPHNVLVTALGRLQISDFGSSFFVTSQQPQQQARRRRRRFGGTTCYSAPEWLGLNNHTIGPAIDLWSLGCLVYALWCGHSPFAAESDALVMDAVGEYCSTGKRRQQPQPSSVVELALLPLVWDDWLCQFLLQVDPSQRSGKILDSNGSTYTPNPIHENTSTTTTAMTTGSEKEEEEQDHPTMLYPKLWEHFSTRLQIMQNDNDNKEEPLLLFLPPKPQWVQQVTEQPSKLVWRDGSLGWSAFLL